MSRKGLNILWVFVLLVLSLIFVQHTTQFSNEKSLQGAVEKIELPEFKWTKWLDGEYQEEFEKYLNNEFGFRPSIVRLQNQIDYSLYDELHARHIIIGKENYLFEEPYIKATLGLDFVGEEKIQDTMKKMKFIADKLKEKNIDLIIVFAAGKGTYFPEFYPAPYDTMQKVGPTNYERYTELAAQYDILHIDFNKYFLQMKDTSSYPLYPKCGIHWSKYAELMVSDSIVRYIEDNRGVNMNHIVVDEINWRSKNLDSDYDIGNGLNLLFQLDTYPMAYPEFHVENKEEADNVKTLFISDSYYWGIFNRGLSYSLFGEGQFWFYNQSIYPDTYEKPKFVYEVDLKKEWEKNDVIILMSTDANLHRFPYDFVKQAYATYSEVK